MRMLALIALPIAVVASAGLAADDHPVLVYPCPLADAPPTIDGVLDDAAWADAPLVSGFTLYNKPEVIAVQTAWRAAYDADRLYIGIQCAEPLADDLAPRKTARDNHDLFGNEAVEVFLEPNHDHANYYQLAFSVGGGVWDSVKSDTVWNADLASATNVGEAKWSVEISIPWADLGIEANSGGIIGVNVCRDRTIANTREWSNWSQTNANFHDPQRFGHLVLSPTPERLAALRDDLRKGDRSGPMRIFSTEGFANTSYREMEQRALVAVDERLDALSRTTAEDASTQAELARLVKSYRDRLAPIRAQIAGDAPIDAAAWTDLDWQLNEIASTLEDAVWKARLTALLSRI